MFYFVLLHLWNRASQIDHQYDPRTLTFDKTNYHLCSYCPIFVLSSNLCCYALVKGMYFSKSGDFFSSRNVST
jgi:hypothetical protein